MKIIDHENIQALKIPPLKFYGWAEEMLHKKCGAVLPPKISMHQPGNAFFNVMPCILPDENCVGVKVISRLPQKKCGPALTSQIMLYDLETGELEAVLDGSLITAMRTGAVAAHSVHTFAKTDFSSIGIMGLGITGTATMDVIAELYRERRITVNLLCHNQQEMRFAQRYQGRNFSFQYWDHPEQVIQHSDVILSCVTCAEENFASIEAFAPGCTVIPVHTMGFQNCDTAFEKVFVDDIGHVRGFKYFEQFKSVNEVSDVICGKVVGREHADERIIVYNIGLAIHDIYVAKRICELLSNGGKNISLRGPTEKMWL